MKPKTSILEILAATTLMALAVVVFIVTWSAISMRHKLPKPVKTTKIELPLSEQRLAGVPVPKNRPLDYDPEHVAAVLAWRLEFQRKIHCQTHIC